MKTATRNGPVTVAPDARRARVTRPGDAIEREADRMADAALAAAPRAPTLTTATDTVLRQAAGNDELGPEFEEDEGFDVAAAARAGGPLPASAGFLDAVRSVGPGHGLAEPQRSRMEHGFGRPLDHVRVHDDAPSARLADRINARAFTHGSDVFFAHGEHRTGADGDRLLAHEVAHTLQRPGAGTVARQPKKKQPPRYDPSRMTDEEKIALRTRIHEAAVADVEQLRAEFKKDPTVDAAKRASWTAELDAAIARASRMTDQRQLQARVGYLQAERRLFDDPFYAWAMTTGKIGYTIGRSALATLSDPKTTFPAAALATITANAAAMSGGADAYIAWIGEGQLYGQLGIDPKQLETSEQSDTEPAAGGGSPRSSGGAIGGESIQDRKILEEMNDALGDLAAEAGINDDPNLVAYKLREMSEEQRRDFYAFARKMLESSKDSPDQKSVFDLVEAFHNLDPASREALEVNREMEETEPGKQEEALPKKILLDVQKEAATEQTAADNAKKIENSLDAIRAVTKDPEAKKALTGLDLGSGAFFEEIAMLLGLLAGGGRESDLVREVGQHLIHEIHEFRDRLERQLLELAVETAAMEVLTIATEGAATPALLALLEKIREVKKLIDTLRRIYDVYQRIKRIIDLVDTVRKASDEYDKFVAWYDEAGAVYAKLQVALDKIDSADDLDDAIEKLEEEMFEKLEQLLEGKLGALLELMYIPADTTLDELRQIIFNIPRGITALGEMWSYYTSGSSKDPHFAEILSIKAFKAGRLLYPFVGLTAALVAEGIQAAFPDRTIEDRINKLIPKSERRPGIGQRLLGLFRRLTPKHYDYDDAALESHLATAREKLQAALDKDEPGTGPKHWAPAWFRDSVRTEIKEVNKGFKAVTVPATRKVKGTDRKTTKVTEQVPIPRFRVRVKRSWFGKRKKLQAVISINPKKTLEVDELSYVDFKGAGLPFGGTKPRRQAAIRKWLRDEGYQVLPDPGGGERIRLPRGQQGTTERPYLQIAGGRITTGIDKQAYTRFIGRLIHGSEDLPEGYLLVVLNNRGDETVSLKVDLRVKGYQQLGLDEHHKLKVGEGTAVPKTLMKPGIKKPTSMEGFDYRASIAAMFPPYPAGAPTYDRQDKDQVAWTRLVASQGELQKRPRALTGQLGYIVRARAFGDLLGSRHLPELRKQDDKGHIVARRFGGEEDYANLVPMLRRENQYPGKWYALESDMADVYVGKNAQKGHYVEFKLSLVYPSSKTRRPSKFVTQFQEKDAKDQNVGSAKARTVDND